MQWLTGNVSPKLNVYDFYNCSPDFFCSIYLQVKQLKHTDERIKLMNEVLSGIKV